ncbi:FAD/NAD(P)-binding domain-containing protein [Xylariaceae sp. FL0255]|nr:FAD/NAD(P)-binding domain-containing protein [Xylariaceae sp. FL0255]
MNSPSSTIRIAILGGGVEGATLLRGLLRQSHIAVEIYNSDPMFKDEGQGIALTPIAEEILAELDPSLRECLNRAGATMSSAVMRIATGPFAGENVSSPFLQGARSKAVNRQRFLDELLRDMPPRMIHSNSRISAITSSTTDNAVILSFADGSQKKYDLLVGADGVYGNSRTFVLGAGHPAVEPKPTGIWGLTIQVPLEKAVQAMGQGNLDVNGDPCQTLWIGDGTVMHHHFLGYGNEVRIAAFATHDDYSKDSPWAKLLTPEEFAAAFSQNHVPACQGIVKLIQSIYTVQIAGIYMMKHDETPTFATKNAVLMGDAAFSSVSMQGGNMTIQLEQAVILTTLLGRVGSRADIPAALKAYDQVCRPRAEASAKYSARGSVIITGRDPEVGHDLRRVGTTFQRHWENNAWTIGQDSKQLIAAAVGHMDHLRSNRLV